MFAKTSPFHLGSHGSQTMPTTDFRELSNSTIAIELDLNGRSRVLRGVAVYEQLPGTVAVLRIRVSDPAGDFELILDEDRFDGQILRNQDKQSDCDFRISLRASNLCLHA
jgi:hypothetical protein